MATADSTSSSTSSWWRRPAGGREVMIVAMPLVVSSLSWTVMTFVDRVFLNSISGDSMSAAFTGSVVWFALICFPLGVCTYAGTFVSQYFGDRQYKRIGPSMWQSVWVAVLFTPLVLLCIPLAPMIFGFADHSPGVMEKQIVYFQILCLCGPGLLIASGFSTMYGGRGETWVVMIVDAIASVVNLVLDYLWIFGYAGFPAGGIEGAGWATVTAMWLKVIIYIALIVQRKHREQFNTLAYRFDRELFGRLVYFGGPSGFQMFIDVSGFTIFVVLVGKLGTMQQEAMSMAFSVNTVAFMPIFGMGMAAAILVGQHLGENRDDLAARATRTSLEVSLVYIGFISALYVLTPDLFLGGFFPEAAARTVEETALHTMAVNLMLFVAAYSLLDAVQMIYVSALKGAGDTQFVLRASLILASVFAICTWLAVEVWKLDVYGCWGIVTAWICLMGVVYLLRYLNGKWRSMRVIEQQHHLPVEEAESLVLPPEDSRIIEPATSEV